MKAERKKFRPILDISSITLSTKTQSEGCINLRENSCALKWKTQNEIIYL